MRGGRVPIIDISTFNYIKNCGNSSILVFNIKKEESGDIFLRICHSIENTLHPSFIENGIVDFDQSRIQRYIFPNNRILLYDDIQSDCIIMQTDQPCTLSTLME